MRLSRTFQETADRINNLKFQWANNLIEDEEYVKQLYEMMSFEDLGDLFVQLVAENAALTEQVKVLTALSSQQAPQVEYARTDGVLRWNAGTGFHFTELEALRDERDQLNKRLAESERAIESLIDAAGKYGAAIAVNSSMAAVPFEIWYEKQAQEVQP